MTVKEHESRKQRSLSLNSLSEHMSGERKGDKVVAQHRVPAAQSTNLHHHHNHGRYEKEHLTNKNEIEHSPADLQRVKGLNVVLTPMGNENFTTNRNLATMHSIFS